MADEGHADWVERWSPDPSCPSDPEFYRRVLDFLPSAVVVVDPDGQYVYCNRAMSRMAGRSTAEAAGTNLADYVYPDDLSWVLDAFTDVVESPEARDLADNSQWAEVFVRMVAHDGSIVPVQIVGAGGTHDETVAGLIYEVRAAHSQDLLGRMLDGMSQGASMRSLFGLVAEMVAGAPLSFEAIVLQAVGDGTFVVAAATQPELTDWFTGLGAQVPWQAGGATPMRLVMTDLPPRLASQLSEAGYRDVWHVAVESPLSSTALRIVAIAKKLEAATAGPINRLTRARELAGAVLLRSQRGDLVAHAAARDPLTLLANRGAYYAAAEVVRTAESRAAVHVDLVGFKHVNADHGQAVGDATLQIVADRVRACCHHTDLVGRLNGDEFGVFLDAAVSEVALQKRLERTVNRLLVELGEPIVVAGQPIVVTPLVGCSIASSGQPAHALLAAAEKAMQDAKAVGEQFGHIDLG